jgi:hypothetical protein
MNREKVQRALVLLTEGLSWPDDLERDLTHAGEVMDADDLEAEVTLDMVKATSVYVDACVERVREMLVGTQALQTALREILLRYSEQRGRPC